METPTDNQLAQATLQFLDRTNLTGNEAMTLIACRQWLTNIASKPEAVPASDSTDGEEIGVA